MAAAERNEVDPSLDRAPAVSVVIPLYNKEATIGRALESVFRQTVQDFEIIVVNDGSTDRSRQTVDSFQDPRLRVIDQPNAGAAAARNRGIAEARAELVAFLDADDEWLPHFLETVLTLRSMYPSAGVYGAAYFIQPPDGRGYGVRLRRIPFDGSQGALRNYFEVASISDPPLHSSSTAVTRAALRLVGGFPEGVVSGEDLLAWAKLASRFPVAYSLRISSVFHCPSRLDFRRSSDGTEVVEREFRLLLDSVSEEVAPGLKAYFGRWHEMRAVIALGRDDPQSARRHLRRAIANRGLKLRLLAMGFLVFLPNRVSTALFKRLRKWRTTPSSQPADVTAGAVH